MLAGAYIMSREKNTKRRMKSSNEVRGHASHTTKGGRSKKRNSTHLSESSHSSTENVREENSTSRGRRAGRESDEGSETIEASKVVVKSLRKVPTNGKKLYSVQMPTRDLSPESIRQAIRAHELSRSLTALSMNGSDDKKASKKNLAHGKRPGRPNITRQRPRKWKPVGETETSPQDVEQDQQEIETKKGASEPSDMKDKNGDVRSKRATRFSRFKYPERLHYRVLPNTHQLESKIPFCLRQFPKYTQLPLRQSCVYKPWGSVSYSRGHATGSASLPHPRLGEAIVDRPASAPPTARSTNSYGLEAAQGSSSVLGLTDDFDDLPEENPQILDISLLSPTVEVDNDNSRYTENNFSEDNDSDNYDGNYSDDNCNDPEDDEGKYSDSQGQQSSRASSPPTTRQSSRQVSARQSSRGSYDGPLSPPASVRSDHSLRSNSQGWQQRESIGGGSRRSSNILPQPSSARRSSNGSNVGRPLSGRSDSHTGVLSPTGYSDDDILEEDEGTNSGHSKPVADRYDPYEEASEVEDEI